MCLWLTLGLLNARKAFDRVSYIKLVGVMFDKGVPARLIKLRIIRDCYGKTLCVIKWNNSLSE